LCVGDQLEVTDDEPPAPVQIVDDDDPADPPFTASGTWSTWSGGHDGDFHYALAGTGSSVAQWEFWVGPGDYQVSATWFEYSNRATDAPYTVLDGTTPLGTVDMNQRLAPNDFSDAGSSWEDLGVYTVSGASLVVRLSNAANGVVAADAVRIERVGPATVTIADASISENGGSTTAAQEDEADSSVAAVDLLFWIEASGDDQTQAEKERLSADPVWAEDLGLLAEARVTPDDSALNSAIVDHLFTDLGEDDSGSLEEPQRLWPRR
jgi:hypothetical protein